MNRRIALVIIGIVFAVPVLLLLGTLGMPVLFVAAWILLLVSVGIVLRLPLIEDSATWPPAKPERRAVGSDVSRLAWTMNSRTGRAGHAIIRRVDSVLDRRLLRLGLESDDPAQQARIDELLGDGIRDILAQRQVNRTDLERVLDAVERLPIPTQES